MRLLGKALTFDDVLLVPAYSQVLPRDTNLATSLSRNIRLNVPLVSAAMDTVTESRLAIALAQEGGIGIVHKNMSPRQQAAEVARVKRYESGVLRDPITVTPDQTVREVIELVVQSMVRDFGIAAPRIGVVGLNPHAGEDGLLGDEDHEIIEPAIEEGCAPATLFGPLVPDAAFRDALGGKYDAMIAMYHDQGLIPVKLIDFDESVNVTIGLPIVRTSPDHGTAYDNAGKGIARPISMQRALSLAIDMVARRANAV
jgi:hypothetical protein